MARDNKGSTLLQAHLYTSLPLFRHHTTSSFISSSGAAIETTHITSDLSSFLSPYVFNHSAFPAAPAWVPDSALQPDPSFGVNTSHFPQLPQPIPARPTSVARRATVSLVLSRLNHFNQEYPLEWTSLYPANYSPPTLDAAHSLLAGWGNTANFFPSFNQPTQQQLAKSPNKNNQFTINHHDDHLLEQPVLPTLPENLLQQPPVDMQANPILLPPLLQS
ncbi:hypothetical protein PCANC_09747 [Puccinia coronata f. sp. avenae]|uniref:Uncharacterized protein n=1 Tax=Puccinia coronata f. sp. avenae TaxID=200324 RepID=A0A2N5VTB5_9BASI|nr:hypothetical protein PCANC_09747 [Puccinia coronata f. sp. avenae]